MWSLFPFQLSGMSNGVLARTWDFHSSSSSCRSGAPHQLYLLLLECLRSLLSEGKSTEVLLSGVERNSANSSLSSFRLVTEISSGCRAQLSPVAPLLNIKHWLGAVSCLPYNFQPLTLFYDALRRLLRK